MNSTADHAERVFNRRRERWGPNALLALDTLAMRTTRGVPHVGIHVMGIPEIEYFAGYSTGDYARDPERVYLDLQRAFATNLIDQYIP
ncbi:MAG: hypothetical protein ACUVWX_14825 [Kiritimatiellia bacterium]